MNQFIPGPADAATQLTESITKTASFNTAWLDMGPGFTPGGLGTPVAGVVFVSAIDVTNADEAYGFKLQEAPDDGTGQPDAAKIADIGASVAPAAPGVVLAKGFVTTRFVRLALTVSGTTPSITYSASLNP